VPLKAEATDLWGRFREIVSDPLNILIDRVPGAGSVADDAVMLHNGNRVPWSGPGSYYGQFSEILIVNRGVHEPLEEFVFQELIKAMPPAPTMIELGAYWAHYSMWMKKARPQASVTMVEPEIENIAGGRGNFARNGYRGEFVQAFVGRGNWELDAYFKSRQIEHLDVLHVDIQGNEGEMMQGAREALGMATVDYICISTHSQALHREVTSDLANYGYRIEVSSDYENDTTSFDGFVFSSSPRVQPLFVGFSHLGRTSIARSNSDALLEAVNKIRTLTRSRRGES
jgi:hypothetical protein